MRDQLTALLHDLDAWARARDEVLDCCLLGGGAMQLFFGGLRRTKDLDLVREPLGSLANRVDEVFGQASGRSPYLDVVPGGLPVLPEGWRGRTVDVPGEWTHLRVRHLTASDLIASKLKAFRPHDRRDIELLCDLHPSVRPALAALCEQDFWIAVDHWQERIGPNRDRVLRYLDGNTEGV